MNRDYSIDILKFLAAFIITWSHLEIQLGQYSPLATGGSFGDCLFFFCSGYTLFFSKKNYGFFNWYKRRINRIYPTVFSWALISYLLFSVDWNIGTIITKGGGFFVTCIMIFYLLFYPIKQYLQKHLWTTLFGALAVCSIAYFFVDHNDKEELYIWKWSAYFIPMLLGAILGKAKNEGNYYNGKQINRYFKLFGLIISILTYYILMYFIGRHSSLHFLNILLIIPQLGVVYFFYALCNSSFAEKAYNKHWLNVFMMWVGGMCLEIYIVQPRLLKAFPMTEIFPLNIIIMFVIIFVCAFALKILSRIWEQTFKDTDYNWKEIIKLY